MEHEELIEKLKKLNRSKSDIESDLGMPKNCLSGFMSGKKKLAKKWIIALENYKTPTELLMTDINKEAPRMIGDLMERYDSDEFVRSLLDEPDPPTPQSKLINPALDKMMTEYMTEKLKYTKKISDLGIWASKIESYCSEVGIEPEDLIFAYKSWFSNKTALDMISASHKDPSFKNLSAEQTTKKQTYDPYKDPTFRKKMGLKD